MLNPESLTKINGLCRALTLRVAILSFIGLCVASDQQHACGEQFLTVGEWGWRPTGLLCFKLVVDGRTEIHLEKFSGEKMESMFKRTMSAPVKSPICMEDAVIAVSSDGTINKIDLQGQLVFSLVPRGFSGVVGCCGRLSSRHIFMTETVPTSNNKGWLHYLYVVAVSGKEPAIISKSAIIHPTRVTRAYDDILVLGPKKTQRLKIPKEASE